jgi:putative metallohydrolase (TIGR04338 family)
MAGYAPRDAQRKKVYRHEHDLEGAFPAAVTKLDHDEVREYIDLAYDLFGLSHRRPTLDFNTRRTTRSVFHPARGEGWGQIEIASHATVAGGWGHKALVVLHEAAHGIVHASGLQGRVQDHGREFVAITHRLYREVLGIPDADLRLAAVSKGVRRARTFDPKAYDHLGTFWDVRFREWSVRVRANTLEEARRIFPFNYRRAMKRIDACEAPF